VLPGPCRAIPRRGARANGIPCGSPGEARRTLRIAAEYADYTNFSGMPEEFSAKSEILRAHCADVGREFEDIVRSANFNVVIGRDDAEVQERLAWIRDHYTSAGLPEDVVESTVKSFADGPLVGTPEQIIEALVDLRSRGMTYAITYFVEQAYDLSGVELFEQAVIPAFMEREQHGGMWHFLHGR
jgi:alkanesulfonate monooxygenase SsuD/methylene tetrahydromethanopterin reductase-like flavin-dependent oxidoreductase (luciferase family)